MNTTHTATSHPQLSFTDWMAQIQQRTDVNSITRRVFRNGLCAKSVFRGVMNTQPVTRTKLSNSIRHRAVAIF